jgi:tripartite-type tricarboxylate transporter receptor subunit TctC
MVVENKPGAGGQIAGDSVVRAAPDGYTLLFGGVNTHGITPSLYRKLAYDPVKDLAPVSLASSTANVLLVHPSLPVKSVAELIAYAKARPGQIDYGSSGIGQSPHLTMEMFRARTGIDLNHVPYKGGGQYALALISGEVKVMFNNLPGELGNIRSGKVRALAVTSARRAPQIPEVPTMAEAGVPGVEVTVWFGFFTPAATPKPVIALLNAGIVKALNDPELRARLDQQSVEAMPSSPEQCAAYVKSEIAKWARVIRDAGVPQE